MSIIIDESIAIDSGPVFISGLDDTIQTFSSANTPQVVGVNTVLRSSGIISSVNGEFLILKNGEYKMIMFPIITKTTGVTISHFLWLQLDDGGGGGFEDIADTNSETVLISGEANDVKTITFGIIIDLNVGDKIRFMNSVTDTNLTIVTKNPPAGNGPRIPSVIMSINRLK